MSHVFKVGDRVRYRQYIPILEGRIIATDCPTEYPLVIMFDNGAIITRRINGSLREDGPSKADIIPAPICTSTWQNVYKYKVGAEYPTKAEALVYKSDKYLLVGHLRRDFEDGAFVRIEFEPYANED